MLPEGIQPDRVFPFYIINNLPAGLTGLLIASVFAAGMSTISTSVNSSATVILNDYFGKKASEASEKFSMRVLLVSTFIFSTLSIIISIAMINVQSVLDSWWKLASIFSGGMLGLFLLGYFGKKVTSKAAIAGVIAGALVIGWMSLSPIFFKGDLKPYSSPFHSYLAIVFGTTVIFLTGFLIVALSRRKLVRNPFPQQ
jgi:SSS family solute:Na+ symporter